MYTNLNENKNKIYSIEDAYEIIKSALGESYEIINSIILSQKQEYENIINSKNQQIILLNNQIKQLQNDNTQLKSSILQLQNKLLSVSYNLQQLSKENENDNKKTGYKYKNIKQNISLKNKEKVNQIQKDLLIESVDTNNKNNENTSKNNNRIIDNEIFNMNKETLNFFNQQLFNKKFQIRKEKTFSKNFNLTHHESKSSNNLENNYSKLQNNTIRDMVHRKKTFNNFTPSNTLKSENNRKDKFNIISKRIKLLKNGLNLNNFDNNIRYNTTYSLNRKNYSNANTINLFDN